MQKAMLYILTGLPYSGKTTFTKELVNRFGFSAVSMDEIIDEKGFDTVKMSYEDWCLVYAEGYENIKRLLRDGKTVILDMGNLKRSERETARQIAEKEGALARLIYIKVSLEEINRRRAVNIETKERGHLDDEEMGRAIDMFEEPAAEENAAIYHQEMDIDKWILENITSE